LIAIVLFRIVLSALRAKFCKDKTQPATQKWQVGNAPKTLHLPTIALSFMYNQSSHLLSNS